MYCNLYEIKVLREKKNITFTFLKRQQNKKKRLYDVDHFLQKFGSKSVSNSDLCFTLAPANISTNKLNDERFREFLTIYREKSVSNESTLRKEYFGKGYNNSLLALYNTLTSE